jgi:hypothetical protein
LTGLLQFVNPVLVKREKIIRGVAVSSSR